MRRFMRSLPGSVALLAGLALAISADAGITPVGIPGIGGVFGVWPSVSRMNAAGQVVFEDPYSSSGGIYFYEDATGLTLVARRGDPAPGTPPGVTWDPFTPAVNSAGGVAFSAVLSGPGVTSANDRALFGPDGSGGFILLAREGDSAPGTGAAFGDSFFFIQGTNGLGEVAFRAVLTGAGVGAGNDSAIFLGDPSGGLSLVAREGDPAPGLPAGIALSGLLAQLSDVGIGLSATLTGPGVTINVNDQAVWRPDGAGGLVLVARTGEPAPSLGGVSPRTLAFQINASGEIVLHVAIGGSGICGSTPCDAAIFGPDGAGGLSLVARVGDPAPGTTDSFTGFWTFALNGVSDVAFLAATNWEFGHTAGPTGAWASDGAGGLRLVALEGDPLPDSPGEVLEPDPGLFAFNNLGDVAMGGSTGPPDYVSAIFFAPVTGGLVTVVRHQDPLEVAPGDVRLVEGSFLTPPFNEPRFLSDERQVLFETRFDYVSPWAVLRADLYTDCVDGIDNDSDGATDFVNPVGDPGCESAADPSEHARRWPCDNGKDDDGDGLADHPADPGCNNLIAPRENPQCQDGLNNDGQFGVDFDGGFSVTGVPGPADPQCAGRAWWYKEAKSGFCGLGFEALFVVVPVAWVRSRRRRRAA